MRLFHEQLVSSADINCERLVADAIAGQSMPVNEACFVGLRMAAAFHSLHRAGFLHWDVQPKTVMRDEQGNALLASCGIDRYLQALLPHVDIFDMEEDADVPRYACAPLACICYVVIQSLSEFRLLSGPRAR